jgi:hypothetical protein
MPQSNKTGLRWKMRFLAAIGLAAALLLVCGAASLFLIEIEDVIYADGKVERSCPTT